MSKIKKKILGRGHSSLPRPLPRGEGDTHSPHPTPLGAFGASILGAYGASILGAFGASMLAPSALGVRSGSFSFTIRTLDLKPLNLGLHSALRRATDRPS